MANNWLGTIRNAAVDNGERQSSQSPAAKSGQLPQTGNSEKGTLTLGLSSVMVGLADLLGMKKKEN